MIKIIKRILSLSIVIIILILTACSDSKTKTIYPTDTNPPYTAENPYVVENLDYTEYYEELAQYCTIYTSYGLGNKDSATDIDDIINGNAISVWLDRRSIFIVKKTNSLSYYWTEKTRVDYGKLTKQEELGIYLTLSNLEIVEKICTGKNAPHDIKTLKKGDTIIIPEKYSISPDKKFQFKTPTYNDPIVPILFYPDGTQNFIDTIYLKNDTYYLLILDEEDRIPDETRYSFGVVDNNFLNVKGKVDLPDCLCNFKYKGCYVYELSEESLVKSEKIKDDPLGYRNYAIDNSKVILYVTEKYGKVWETDTLPIHLILSITAGAVMFGIITVVIILRKRKTAVAPTEPTPPTENEAPQRE